MIKHASHALGEVRPLTPAEIQDLSVALRELAFTGTVIPQRLIRRDATHTWGSTLEALPAALDLLGDERDGVVVELLRQFERAVTDNLNHVRNRDRSKPFDFDRGISARYFSSSVVTGRDRPAYPKTAEGIEQVKLFLQSDKAEVREHAAWMLSGTSYDASTADALLATVKQHGVKCWPNPFAKALASFAREPEVYQQLLDLLSSPDKSLRHVAMLAFSAMGSSAGEPAIAQLEKIASTFEDNLQSTAISALRAIVAGTQRLRTIALAQITSSQYWVRNVCIWALEGFDDPDTVAALIHSLRDQGGHDNENDLDAAKLLQKIPLHATEVLAPLIEQFRQLMRREEATYAAQQGQREEIQALANAFKEAANARGNFDPELGVVRISAPEILVSIARLFGNLGPEARPALPILEECLTLNCVRGTTNVNDFQAVIAEINASASPE